MNFHIKKLSEKVRYYFKNFNTKRKVLNLRNYKKEILSALAVVFLVFAVLGIIFYDTVKKGLALKASVANVEASIETQDFPKLKSNLAETKVKLREFDTAFGKLRFLRYIPFIGFIAGDVSHFTNAATHGIEAGEIVVKTLEPYADLAGFKGGGETTAQTTQERIDFIVKAIPELLPKSDLLIEKAKLVKAEIDKVDPDRYPQSIAGREVRPRLKEIIELMDQSVVFIENSKPMLEVLPYLLGAEDGERKYLVLFQNDKELRATGGFWTAYTIGKVNNGRFEPGKSSDIYDLDEHYKPSVPAPAPIKKHLKGPYLISDNYRLRDMNWSPDFKESVKLFLEEAKKTGMEEVDGVIAVDTEVLVNILYAIGPIEVSEFGKFSTEIIPECKCPQVVYELESFADVEGPIVWSENEPGKIVHAPPNYDDRKRIIGPLMNSILSNSLGQPPSRMPLLMEAAMRSMTEKHLLVYMKNEKAQSAVEQFGIAGTVKEYDGDYLHISDSNFGGRKSNLYVTQEVLQEIEKGLDGTFTKTLTITYKNPEKYDGWLNSVLPNYMRVYVPEGSELISFNGVEYKEEPYEELGKTVFAGFFQLRPLGVSKVTLKYKLPGSFEDGYNLLIQKQPGTNAPFYTININGKKSEEFYLKTDREVNLKI